MIAVNLLLVHKVRLFVALLKLDVNFANELLIK